MRKRKSFSDHLSRLHIKDSMLIIKIVCRKILYYLSRLYVEDSMSLV